MEFDKSKILTVVTADQAKVGQKGWFASNVEMLSRLVQEEQPKELLGFNSNNAVHAFKTVFQNHALFYPAPELSYKERQAEWVKENNVKVGTKVRFTKGFEADSDGSDCCEHRNAKGVEGCIDTIEKTWMFVRVLDGGGWSVPFTSLEVIKEPTYRPFNTGEEFKPFKDKWVLYNQATRRILSYNNIGVIIAQANWDDSGVRFITFETAFKEFQFEEGTPFGVKES